MILLFPSPQAERIRASIVDYLSTTFALTDAESRSALAAITAALYTGDTTGSADQRSRVTPQGLITDRHHIRHNPPDILLTNYKMLDQLLLRPEDQELWATSATVNQIRYKIERVIANIKTWRALHTGYRTPLQTFPTTITAILGLISTYTP